MKFLTPIICVIVAGALYFWYVSPTYAEMKALRVVTGQYEAALTRARQVGVKRDELAIKYNNFNDADVARLQKILPDKIDNIKLIVDIDSIAKKYGSSIREIKAGDEKAPVENKPYGSLATTFSVTMSYDNFLRFIIDLQKSLRLTDISVIDFKSTDSGLYSYNITVRNYWLK